MAEPEPLGTAGAIRFAADQLGDELDDRFLALNGDVLTDLDLTALLRAHERVGRRAATIALHPVEDSAAYGLVRTGAERRGARVRREDRRGACRVRSTPGCTCSSARSST